MLALTASHLSPSDTWRRKDQTTTMISTMESWRDRRRSKGSREAKKSSNGSGEMKETSGNWRIRKDEKATKVEEANVYGDGMPAEWKLQKMYKQLKIDTNKFITWLVESVYPCIEGLHCSERLPPYITLSCKQAKGMSQTDRAVALNSTSSTSTDHPKYDIVVNNITELAGQTTIVPPNILDLLERLIIERTEYSYWMSRKSTDNLATRCNESHEYYVKIMKEVKTIFAERMAPGTRIASQANSANPANITNIPAQTKTSTLGKRRNSSTNIQGPDGRKAVKIKSKTPQQKHNLRNDIKRSTTQDQQQEWRQMVALNCEKLADKKRALIAKPMSYAAAVRGAIAG